MDERRTKMNIVKHLVPETLDDLIRDAMEEWQVPGISLAVVGKDQPDHVKALGWRDVEAELPVTPDTQFTLCSITKSFTALGLAMLVDDGLLDWEKPVREYLPDFRLHDAIATDRVTVQDLLCHRSGLPRHDWIWMPGDMSRDEMFAALRHLEPSKDIRSDFQYCNLGYLVAGMIAERLSGQSWEDFTRARIMAPLGMIHTGFSHEDLQCAPDSARPYVLEDVEKPGTYVRRRAALWSISDTPAGGINAAASDMARYMRLYLADGEVDGTRLVSSARLRDLQTALIHSGKSEFAENGDAHYGFGLASRYYRGERVVSHSGGWIGWSTLMTLLPDRGFGITVLSNRAGNPAIDIATYAILDHLCGRDQVPWIDRFRERRRAFIAQRPIDHAAKAKQHRPNAPPRALDEYVGDYAHPGYGRISILQRKDRLQCNYRGMSGGMNHRHYDLFELDEQPDTLWPSNLTITFLYDREGRIDRLCAPFESQVPDIVFRRLAAGEALDPAFRQSCVGTYRNGATTLVVALDKDDRLTLSPSGQPNYRLAPYRDRIFTLEGHEGFRLEFISGEAGPPSTIIFYQPNGTFQAQRETE